MPTPTVPEIIDSLVADGLYWVGDTITFSIPGPGAKWPGYTPGGPETYGNEPTSPQYSTLSATQANAFRDAINAWAELIAIKFVETDDATSTGDIRIAFTDVGMWGGYASYPKGTYGTAERAGDIWISATSVNRTLTIGFDLVNGESPNPVLLHEIGHALGLKHPFAEGAVLPKPYDDTRYTIMSYEYVMKGRQFYDFAAVFLDGKPLLLTGGSYVLVYQPMVYDILAIQSIYGINTSTRSGNDTYTWKQDERFIEAIYDAGGIDTIDLSDHARASIIDLTPGAYSSIAPETLEQQKAYWISRIPQYTAEFSATLDKAAAEGRLYTGENNLGIAFSTIIENVKAGRGADTIVGNDAANMIDAGAGSDFVTARGGDDTLVGGDGQDTLWGGDGRDSLSGGAGFDQLNGNAGEDFVRGGEGDDWVVGGKDNDQIYGENGFDVVYGNLGDDSCYGGDGADWVRGGQGNDLVDGGAGNDWLAGDRGDDTITGGAGADIFYFFAGAGVDRVTDFNSTQGDRVLLDAGAIYTVSYGTFGAVIDLGDGDQLILAGITAQTLGDWLV